MTQEKRKGRAERKIKLLCREQLKERRRKTKGRFTVLVNENITARHQTVTLSDGELLSQLTFLQEKNKISKVINSS